MTLPRVRVYLGAIRPRLLERPLWRYRHRHGLSELTPAELRRRLPGGDDRAILARFAEGYAGRFPHMPARREAFRAELAEHPEHAAAVLAAAERTDGLVFDVLGSGPVSLGPSVNWHRDFKSGREWPLDLAWRMDYTNLDAPSDVKVPWELSRFHCAAWLGQAYWITGHERWAERFRALVESWWEANPPGRGVNWAVPMELAIRAANWILAFGWFHGAASMDEAFWLRLLGSLWRHGEVIRGNLEYQRRLGNHYITNGMGLVLLGACFGDTRTGRGWLRDGQRILEREIRRQVHPDGVDYEKSVSYHRLVLECFYLGFIRGEAAGLRFSPGFRARLARMFNFTAAYTRPDGSTPLVSDADDGRVLRLAPADAITDHRHALAVGAALFGASELTVAAPRWHAEPLWLLGPGAQAGRAPVPAAPPRPRSCAFPDAGYYVMRGPDTHTFLDAGEIGFAGDSGHGHNDTLSFELHAPGGTFIVDSGTYLYTSDPPAHRAFASTRAHNTLVVDGREVADFAGLWHLAADTTAPRVQEWITGEDEDRWVAEHHGYGRLAAPVVHRRSVRFERAARRWTLRDSLIGRGHHTAELFLHLHPDATVRRVTEREVEVRLGSGALRIGCSDAIAIESGWVAPSYGVKRRAAVLRVVHEEQTPFEITTTIQWRDPGDGRLEGDRP
jgi:uncharacterized heparinase superfamily protein